MRWISFVILLVVVTAFQKTVAPFVAVHTIRPDLMVIVAVHYALAARPYDALLACWCVGLAIDLTSLSFTGSPNIGLYALSLGLIGFLIVKVRDLTFRQSTMTQLFFTFATKLLLSMMTGAYMLHAAGVKGRFGEVFLTGLYAAVFTAVLAPYGHWVLKRLRSVLGIGATHRLRIR